MRFVNSRGFRLSLYRVPGVEAPGDSVPLPPYSFPDYTSDLLRPEPAPACGEFFQAERRRLRYVGRYLPVALDYALVRDLSGSYPGGPLNANSAYFPLLAVADTLPDVVVVSFNEHAFARFPVVRRPLRLPFGPVRYADTVRVAGQLLRGVYQYELSTFGLSAGAVAPSRLYFQPGQGVVGFTYTNDEEWARY
ncbi:hypothetical protein DLM85_18565 [Hymenobacter edaphi]|uniref:Uncharacterized protein n=1 Tax=Hymenobacter edaphi TaxID=2211146 RepID=A0A328BCH1_9BACT|nr:hypothetical protein DLM85_18565 [Hymenobacter edaphi]